MRCFNTSGYGPSRNICSSKSVSTIRRVAPFIALRISSVGCPTSVASTTFSPSASITYPTHVWQSCGTWKERITQSPNWIVPPFGNALNDALGMARRSGNISDNESNTSSVAISGKWKRFTTDDAPREWSAWSCVKKRADSVSGNTPK